MKVETTPLAQLSGQETPRGGTSSQEGESFEVALAAQIATAGIARPSAPTAERESVAIRQAKTKKIDPTRQAEEKLASRPHESELGLQSAVQADLKAPEARVDSTQPEANASVAGHPEGNVSARSVSGGREHRSESPATSAGVQGRAAVAEAQGSEARGGNEQNSAGQTPQKQVEIAGNYSSAPRSAEMPGSVSGASSMVAVQGRTESIGTGRGGGISAVDALGALGRKTTFKLQTAERPQTKADAERFIAQASKALAAAVRREGGTMVMRLTPENLGLLKVSIETKDGSVNAKVEASERSARELLTENVDSLQKALEAHGVRVEKIEIVRMGDLQGISSFFQPGTGSESSGGSGNTQAEDRRFSTQRTDATGGANVEASGLMDEPAGIYLHGVELRVDAIA